MNFPSFLLQANIPAVTNDNLQGYVANYSFVMIIGSVLLIALFWFSRKALEKNPNMTFGDVINKIFVREKVSIFLIALGIINLTEGIMAASITPLGEVPVNPLARVLSHLMISIVSIVFGINTSIIAHKIFKPKAEKRALGFALFLGYLLASILLPYANLALIANGLKQTAFLNYFILGLNPFNNMAEYYYSLGLGYAYSPWDNMQYVLAVSITLTGVHYFLTFLDGMHTVYDSKFELGIFIKNKNGEKGTDKEKEKGGTKSPKEPISDLLNFYYYNTTNDKKAITALIDKSHDIHDAMNATNKSLISAAVQNLASKSRTVLADASSSKADKKANIIGVHTEIEILWKGSIKDGKGFGMTLPKKTTATT